MNDREIVRKSPRPTLVIVTAILQIVFGVITLCGPLVVFAGVPERMAAWQDDMQARIPKGKGQMTISQQHLQKMIHERIPWLHTYERAHNGSSLVLSGMMIAGGIGLLYMRSWAWGLTILWAVLSLAFTVTVLTLTVAYVTPQTISALEVAFDEMPDPPPGQPDPRPAIKNMMQLLQGPGAIFASALAVLGALFPLAYAIVVLTFMLTPSTRQAVRRWSTPTAEHHGEWERDEEVERRTNRTESDEPPDDRFRTER